MTISEISSTLGSAFSLSPVALNEWEVKTNANFKNGEEFKIYLVNEKDTWYLTDKKATLQYMNAVYDLKATDVKNCIAAVIKIYGFSIIQGCLRAEVMDEVQLSTRIFDYIICIGQLANMYAFFDKP